MGGGGGGGGGDELGGKGGGWGEGGGGGGLEGGLGGEGGRLGGGGEGGGLGGDKGGGDGRGGIGGGDGGMHGGGAGGGEGAGATSTCSQQFRHVRELHESHTPSVYESQHSLPSSRAFGGRGGGGGGSVHAQMLTRALPMTAVALSGFRRTSSQPRGISWSPGRSNTGSGAETPALPLLSWWALWVRPPKACASARRSAATKECNFMRVKTVGAAPTAT